MATKAAAAAKAAEAPLLTFAALAAQAVETHGEITSDERMTGESTAIPTMQIIGASAKDALFYDEELEENISRAGQFRFYKDGEVAGYFKKITGVVIIENRVGQTAYFKNEPICRGISTVGLNGLVCISREGMQAPGVSCSKCPLFRFNKATTHPLSGEAMKPGDYCKAALELYAFDPSGTINEGQVFRISFTSMAIGDWKSFLKPLERDGAKLWAFLTDVGTAFEAPVKSDQSGHYNARVTPNADPILSADTFKLAEEKRAELGELLKPPTPPAQPAALPAGDAPSAPLPAGIPEDPFKDA